MGVRSKLRRCSRGGCFRRGTNHRSLMFGYQGIIAFGRAALDYYFCDEHAQSWDERGKPSYGSSSLRGEDPSLPERSICERCGRDVHTLQLTDFEGGFDNACVYCTDTLRRIDGEWVEVKGTMHD